MVILTQPAEIEIQTKFYKTRINTNESSPNFGAILEITPVSTLGNRAWINNLGGGNPPVGFHLFLGGANPLDAWDNTRLTMRFGLENNLVKNEKMRNSSGDPVHACVITIQGTLADPSGLKLAVKLIYAFSDHEPFIRFGGQLRHIGTNGVLVGIEFPRLGPSAIGKNDLIFFPWAWGNFPFLLKDFVLPEERCMDLRGGYPGCPWTLVHWSHWYENSAQELGITFSVQDPSMGTKEVWFGTHRNSNEPTSHPIGAEPASRPLFLYDQYNNIDFMVYPLQKGPGNTSWYTGIPDERLTFFPLFFPFLTPGSTFNLPECRLYVGTDVHWAPPVLAFREWQRREAHWSHRRAPWAQELGNVSWTLMGTRFSDAGNDIRNFNEVARKFGFSAWHPYPFDVNYPDFLLKEQGDFNFRMRNCCDRNDFADRGDKKAFEKLIREANQPSSGRLSTRLTFYVNGRIATPNSYWWHSGCSSHLHNLGIGSKAYTVKRSTEAYYTSEVERDLCPIYYFNYNTGKWEYGPIPYFWMCPGSEAWRDWIFSVQKMLIDLGAHGCDYDQYAASPGLLCFSSDHRHSDYPQYSHGPYQYDLLKEIIFYSRKLHKGREGEPDFTRRRDFVQAIEGFRDSLSRWVDIFTPWFDRHLDDPNNPEFPRWDHFTKQTFTNHMAFLRVGMNSKILQPFIQEWYKAPIYSHLWKGNAMAFVFGFCFFEHPDRDFGKQVGGFLKFYRNEWLCFYYGTFLADYPLRFRARGGEPLLLGVFVSPTRREFVITFFAAGEKSDHFEVDIDWGKLGFYGTRGSAYPMFTARYLRPVNPSQGHSDYPMGSMSFPSEPTPSSLNPERRDMTTFRVDLMRGDMGYIKTTVLPSNEWIRQAGW